MNRKNIVNLLQSLLTGIIGLLILDYFKFAQLRVFWVVLIAVSVMGSVYYMVSKKPKPPAIPRALGMILALVIYFGYTHLAGHLVFSSLPPYKW